MASSNQGGSKSENDGGNRGGNQGGDTSKRGFASMDPEKQREIASEGGKAAHESGKAHEFTSEEARDAGRKGGQASSGGSNQGGGDQGGGAKR
ncbi:MAG TPA: KGG domain-containing protein [Ramlibacter sp.]|nr:KGG domain-containing protein [Ramlibacter sp.]